MLFKAFLAGIATLSIIGIVAEFKFPPRPVLIYNPSASQPIGWYKLNRKIMPQKGLRVAAYAPEWARIMADERGYLPYDFPLIKEVLAVEGDKVCYNFGYVSVPNGLAISLLEQDRLGREMPVPKRGCSTLKAGEYFIASPHVQDGFDSRYFGIIGRNNLIGVVDFLGKSKNPKIAEKAE